jgi:hypothetical protein
MSCKKKERPNLGLQAGPDMKDRKTVCGIGDARARSHASPKLCSFFVLYTYKWAPS